MPARSVEGRGGSWRVVEGREDGRPWATAATCFETVGWRGHVGKSHNTWTRRPRPSRQKAQPGRWRAPRSKPTSPQPARPPPARPAGPWRRRAPPDRRAGRRLTGLAVDKTVILLTLNLSSSILKHLLALQGKQGAAGWQSRRRLDWPSASFLSDGRVSASATNAESATASASARCGWQHGRESSTLRTNERASDK